VLRRIEAGTFEVHCHGGPACVAAVLESLARLGAAIDRGEVRTAAAELTDALAAARTQRTAAILLDQLAGAFDREVDAIEHALKAAESRDEAKQRLRRLNRLIPFGWHLTEPWQVVLAGLPNVGKSSLINALVGFRRAIVHDQPGTTRDVLTAVTAFEGWPVVISDTAGQRNTNDPIELAGVERAIERSRDADLLVLVLDASAAWSEEEAELCDEWPDALTIFNKVDLPAGRELGRTERCVSASTGAGIAELARAIAARLVPYPPPAGAVVPATPSQRERLAQLDLLASQLTFAPGS